jgi:nitrogen fixation NifU-like protein
MYSEKVMEHFKNPRNIGEIDDAHVILEVGDPNCGDSLLLFIKI